MAVLLCAVTIIKFTVLDETISFTEGQASETLLRDMPGQMTKAGLVVSLEDANVDFLDNGTARVMVSAGITGYDLTQNVQFDMVTQVGYKSGAFHLVNLETIFSRTDCSDDACIRTMAQLMTSIQPMIEDAVIATPIHKWRGDYSDQTNDRAGLRDLDISETKLSGIITPANVCLSNAYSAYFTIMLLLVLVMAFKRPAFFLFIKKY
jgi:hypothetical protein